MKTPALTKIFKQSLQCDSNFNTELDANPQDVIANYKDLLIEYYKFINENIKITNRGYFEYIMNRGLDTITHVFITILYCTKNHEIVYYYAQKSIYLYIEFVNQISEIDKHFLQLTSRDAVIYVYKKTIFDLGIESRKKCDVGSVETNDRLTEISTHVNIIKTVFMKLIQTGNETHAGKENDFFVSTINSIKVPFQDKETLKNTMYLIDALFYHVKDTCKFGELIRGLMHYMNNTPTFTMKYIVINDDFILHINEPVELFMKWIIN